MPVRSGPLYALARRVAGARQLNHLVRAEPVVRLVREAGSGTLLDVGSGSLGLASLLEDAWRVTALDVSFMDYGAGDAGAGRVQRIVGDVRAMPFGDSAFDVVVALDVMEHLAPADRPVALAELGRVARRRLIVGCPTGKAAMEADRGLAATLGPSAPPWLAEHLDLGFPEADELIAPLRGLGALTVLANERVDRHVVLTLRELQVVWFLPTRTAARVLGAALRAGGRRAGLAGRLLLRLRGGDADPAYRTIVAVDLGR